MANEILKRDENNQPVIGLVTDDSNQFIKMGRIDDTTKGLKVMIVGGVGTGSVTSVATDATLTGGPITTTGTLGIDLTHANTWSGIQTFSVLPQSSVVPVSANDLTNKSYVDLFAQGLSVRQSARAATTTTLAANTYANGASGVAATLTANANGALAVVDGVALIANDRVLIKNEASGLKNGIYTVTQVGDGSNPYILTRTTDADQSSELSSGTFLAITAGTINANTLWVQSTTGTIVVGTTALVWTVLSGAGTGTGTVTNVSVVPANGVSGSVATSTTTPAITLTLGAITPTTVNGLTVTTSTGTLTITNGKTLSLSNTLTFTGTDSSSVAFGTGGTVAYRSNNLSVFAATTSAQLAGIITNETGSGSLVFATSPTLVTPTLGVATVTSVNKVAITAPATSATLTIADGKTFTVSNTLTMQGTDSTVFTFPSSSDTVVTLSATQTLTNKSIAETQVTFTDVTTGNVSTTKHGFAPKAPNDATKYLDGTGAYSVPAGSSSATVTTFYTLPISGLDSYGSLQNATNTRMRGGMFSLPFSITVNTITLESVTVGTSGTVDVAIYSADGQTKVISDQTTGTISGAGIQVMTLGSPVALTTGNYYLMVVPNSTADVNLKSVKSTDTIINGSTTVAIGYLDGLSAGTLPATFTPTALTAAFDQMTLFRFN